MKAPDKKYPLSTVGDLLASMPPNEIVFMPDKMYFDGIDTSTIPRLAINEEYIRKDALIEWLEKTAAEYKKRSDEGELVWQNWCAYNDVINHINSM